MDIKKNVLLIGRIDEEDEEGDLQENATKTNNQLNQENNEEGVEDVTEIELDQNDQVVAMRKPQTKVKKLENVVFIGRMEENENFEENPVIEDGALKTIIDASTKQKTLVFEVCISVIILFK
jgi:hypothetical protein